MCPEIQFHIFRFGTFNLFVGVGLVFWVCATLWQLKRMGIRGDKELLILSAIPVSLLAVVAMACLSDIAFRWRHFWADPSRVGATFYGGLLGFIGFWWLYARWKGLDFAFLMNVFLPAVAIAQAFGRIGCFLGGCCYGRPISAWGVMYPEGAPAFVQYGHCPVAPVQLMESAWLFCVGIALFSLIAFRCRYAWYFILVGLGRFGFEFLRGDVRSDVWTSISLSPAQCISLLLVGYGLVLLIRRRIGQCREKSPVGGKAEKEAQP